MQNIRTSLGLEYGLTPKRLGNCEQDSMVSEVSLGIVKLLNDENPLFSS